MFHEPLVLFFGFGKTTLTFFPISKPLILLDGALFVVSFLLNTLFVLFCRIWTCNLLSCAYLVAVCTVNTPSASYCWFLTAANVPSIFDAMIWTWKHQLYHFSIFQNSKYVRRDLVCCLLASKCVFSFDFRHFNK